jgi:hypothetical protein
MTRIDYQRTTVECVSNNRKLLPNVCLSDTAGETSIQTAALASLVKLLTPCGNLLCSDPALSWVGALCIPLPHFQLCLSDCCTGSLISTESRPLAVVN